MRRTKLLSTVALVLFVLLLSSCADISNAGAETTSPPTLISTIPDIDFGSSEKKLVIESDFADLKSGMTLGAIVDLIGNAHASEYSARYPLLYSWETENGSKLYIKFETDDYDEFMSKYQNGDFVLSNEELIYCESGLRMATPNETKVYGEWIRSYQAVCAYVVTADEETILFGMK